MTPTRLHLPSDLVIEGVERRLEGLFSRWYDLYDAVPVPRDNVLRAEEIALCIMMNSRMSGNTAFAIWERRDLIEKGLCQIPSDADLAAPDVPWEGLQAAIDPFQFIPRAKAATATKILHKKRPALIPMLDSLLEGHYCSKLKVRAETYGGYAANLIKLFREDLLAVLAEVTVLCVVAAERGKPVTPVRMLDHLLWSQLSPAP